MTKTYNEQLQEIVTDYIKDGLEWPATTRQLAGYAIDHRKWRPQRSTLVDRCAEELSRAMREEYIVDPQGRTVRAKHVARVEREGKQLMLWADIRSASREHMQMAFQLRRQQIVGDSKQLKADVDSYNENRTRMNPIQMSFDFTPDVMEAEALIASLRAGIANGPEQPYALSRSSAPASASRP